MLKFRFTTSDGSYQGAYFRDYFSDDGYARAKDAAATDISVAQEILEQTYKGADVDGIGVTWTVDIDNMKYCH